MIKLRSSTEVDSLPLWYFGDGSDGDVTITGNTILSTDMYYNNLTVNSGVTLSGGSKRIFVKESLINYGTIDNSGVNGNHGGSNGTGGSLVQALNDNARSLPLPLAGFTGATCSPGNAGNNASTGAQNSSSMLNEVAPRPSGGNGGAGQFAGGLGGPASATNYLGLTGSLTLNPGRDGSFAAPSLSWGAPGGGAGGGDNLNAGGGGGSGGTGGGAVFISAKYLTNSGTISARGGNGGNGGTPVTGNCGGGGAGSGGAGGLIYLIYQTIIPGTLDVSKGNHGTPGNGVGTGLPGESVSLSPSIPDGKIVKYNIIEGEFE